MTAVTLYEIAREFRDAADKLADLDLDEQTLADTLENRAAWLKGNILAAMQSTGVLKIESPYFKLAVRNNPPAVEVFDEAQVPTEYQRKTVSATLNESCEVTYENELGIDWITVTGPRELFKLEAVPDKAVIKEAIAAKQDVPGCRLTVGKRLDVR